MRWQKDFCDPDGFGASLGNDATQLRAAIPAAAAVLAAARAAGMPVIHTLVGPYTSAARVEPRLTALGLTAFSA